MRISCNKYQILAHLLFTKPPIVTMMSHLLSCPSYQQQRIFNLALVKTRPCEMGKLHTVSITP